jgi:peptidoglycan glycosyltransferase
MGLVLLVCFGLLFLQLNHLQVLQSHALATAPGNPRVSNARLDEARGDIVSRGGVVLAESVRTKGGPLPYRREYPTGPLFAGITGFDSIIYGLTGLEATENTVLTPHAAPIRSLSDLFRQRTTTDTVILTVSDRLQALAAKLLGTEHGAVVALDPTTGAILAMYGSPSYNPNLLASPNVAVERKAWKTYLAEPDQPLLDRAYRQRYPPGSTFKIVTASAVYDHDPALAHTTFPDLAALPLPGTTHLLHNYGGEVCGGELPVLFKVSCDTGFGKIGLDLGATNLATEARAFGFDAVPPIDLPDPAVSYFPPASSFANQQPELAFSAIGQGNVSASALQMAMVAGAIADRGVMMRPYVVAQVRDDQGDVISTTPVRVWRRATSAATAAKVTQLMIGVTHGGTASNVAIPGVEVAAKTGTAQVGNSLSSPDDDWLVAFAPATHPKVAVAVVVTNQPPGTTGSSTAGPICRAMLEAILSGQDG